MHEEKKNMTTIKSTTTTYISFYLRLLLLPVDMHYLLHALFLFSLLFNTF